MQGYAAKRHKKIRKRGCYLIAAEGGYSYFYQLCIAHVVLQHNAAMLISTFCEIFSFFTLLK
jgi:hypothetical protein